MVIDAIICNHLNDVPHFFQPRTARYLINLSTHHMNNPTSNVSSPLPPSTASISAETMEIHHSKHHNTYVTNLNAALEKLDSAVSTGDVSSIISLQGALKFNGGGHLNHTLFWENLCAQGSSEFPSSGALKEAIDARFGDVEGMKKELGAMTVGVQGSGWGWLGFDAKTGEWRRWVVIVCINFFNAILLASIEYT